jgi:tetratricopeptide (TPR) repeat protein
MGEYTKALSFYEKALQIEHQTLSPNRPSLACTYGHLGMLYYEIKEYSKAVSYCQQAFDMVNVSLPPNHPDIKVYRDNLELVKKEL